jgi:hypothetical protein
MELFFETNRRGGTIYAPMTVLAAWVEHREINEVEKTWTSIENILERSKLGG